MYCSGCGTENTNDSSYCLSCGRAIGHTKPDELATAYHNLPNFKPGTVLQDGRYKIQRLLGAGGMGTVYLALDLDLGRSVVIKIPHASMMHNPDFVGRFNSEITSQTSLSHRGIIHIYGRGNEGGVPYVVMQYVEGGTLGDRLDHADPMEPAEVLRWLAPVAEALDFVHEQQFVHRDIKPDNILFDNYGGVYVSDFGIGKALEESQMPRGATTKTGAFIGTPSYLAPEYVDRNFTPHCDQYSLAVVVYRALTGELPHQAATTERLMIEKATKPPTPLDRYREDLSPRLVASVMRALSIQAEDRYPTCKAFADDFGRGAFEDRANWANSRSGRQETATLRLDTDDEDAAASGSGPRWAVVSGVSLLLVIGAWLAYAKFGLNIEPREIFRTANQSAFPVNESRVSETSRDRQVEVPVEVPVERADAAAIAQAMSAEAEARREVAKRAEASLAMADDAEAARRRAIAAGSQRAAPRAIAKAEALRDRGVLEVQASRFDEADALLEQSRLAFEDAERVTLRRLADASAARSEVESFAQAEGVWVCRDLPVAAKSFCETGRAELATASRSHDEKDAELAIAHFVLSKAAFEHAAAEATVVPEPEPELPTVQAIVAVAISEPPVAPIPTIDQQAQAAMGKYKAAYESLDVSQLASAWTMVTKQRQGMSSFFDAMKSVHVKLSIERIVPDGDGARVDFVQTIVSNDKRDTSRETKSKMRATLVRNAPAELVIANIAPIR